jgi:hypothetical protein
MKIRDWRLETGDCRKKRHSCTFKAKEKIEKMNDLD